MVQQQVSIGNVGLFSPQHEFALQTDPGCRSSRLPAVIRLGCAQCQDCPGPMCKCIRHQEFQLTGFVSAEGQTGLIVAFDEDSGSSKRG
jgi:hypothetical protein